MRTSAFSMPFFALLAGACGYYLRLIELSSVFDKRTGLPQRGAAITLALIILTIGFLLVVCLYTLRIRAKYTSPQGFQNAFGTEPLAYPFIFVVVGIAWLGATVKYFFDLLAVGTLPYSEICFLVLSAISAISITFFAVEMYQDSHSKFKLALSAVPTVFMCFWLILFYSRNSANPILLSYCYQCLAIISSTLGFYFTSGFIYNKPALGRTVFAFFAAIFFCFVTLADNHTISIKIIFIALIVINVVYSSMLISRMKRRV